MRKTTANLAIKKQNRTDIYQLLRNSLSLSRQDIVQQLQLSLPTVTKNLLELEQEGLIAESGSISNTGGRRAKTYSIVRDAKIAIGLDITRHHVSAVSIDLTGTIIATERRSILFERSDSYYQKLGELVEAMVASCPRGSNQVLGVGIGVPGLISADNSEVVYGEILHFTGSTCEEFSKHFDFPAALYNDANAAGFAELWSGTDKDNAFYIMLSNNIGGAVWINGQSYCGETLKSGEVGHLVLEENGKPCYCGQSGCVDCYLAATELSKYTDDNLASFFERLESGDQICDAIWQTYLSYLARTVSNVHILFDCPIILGGYVGGYIEPYMSQLIQKVERKSSFSYPGQYVKCCTYKKEAIAAGSALHFIDSFLKAI